MDEDRQGFKYKVFMVYSIRVTFREKEELPAYQLKYVLQVLFEEWTDERHRIEGPIDEGVYNMTFLDRFFPLDFLRVDDKKLVEFRNLYQGGMIVKEYDLIFTQSLNIPQPW